jgi:hypothetical protein
LTVDAVRVGRMVARYAESTGSADPYQVIHLGGEVAAIVPLEDFAATAGR